eukprot:754929-Hanusia_phi.AAC.1
MEKRQKQKEEQQKVTFSSFSTHLSIYPSSRIASAFNSLLPSASLPSLFPFSSLCHTLSPFL